MAIFVEGSLQRLNQIERITSIGPDLEPDLLRSDREAVWLKRPYSNGSRECVHRRAMTV